MTVDRTPLLKALGVDLPDDLLTVALTHRSYAYENGGLPTNERLEFLGDAVLGLVITAEIFAKYPDRTEGELAKLKSAVVNTQALAQIARQLTDDGLGAYLLLGRGEVASGGAQKANLLADGLESLLGATYVRARTSRSRATSSSACSANCSIPRPISAQAWTGRPACRSSRRRAGSACRPTSSPRPAPSTTSTSPPEPSSTASTTAQGSGRTKKEAEQHAAAAAYAALDPRCAEPRCLNCPKSRSSGAGCEAT